MSIIQIIILHPDTSAIDTGLIKQSQIPKENIHNYLNEMESMGLIKKLDPNLVDQLSTSTI